ncbi:hypothetical protein GCM10010145_43410 [Streptomyces ruber]|uniref:Uncharacterized protein n=2 Tax=Streptomyces TaxID=1883 RepID=A0A918BHL7_9ACTN|nr:hypothetical protein [Streptomyces ruber]GGQ68991.1 hypothetical protein GCM10010145_43410 [Streptomyces ruber]
MQVCRKGGALRRAALTARQDGTVRLRTAAPVAVRTGGGAPLAVRRPERAVAVFRVRADGEYVVTPV